MKVFATTFLIAMSPSIGFGLSSLLCTDHNRVVKVSEQIRDDSYAKEFELEIENPHFSWSPEVKVQEKRA